MAFPCLMNCLPTCFESLPLPRSFCLQIPLRPFRASRPSPHPAYREFCLGRSNRPTPLSALLWSRNSPGATALLRSGNRPAPTNEPCLPCAGAGYAGDAAPNCPSFDDLLRFSLHIDTEVPRISLRIYAVPGQPSFFFFLYRCNGLWLRQTQRAKC